MADTFSSIYDVTSEVLTTGSIGALPNYSDIFGIITEVLKVGSIGAMPTYSDIFDIQSEVLVWYQGGGNPPAVPKLSRRNRNFRAGSRSLTNSNNQVL